MRPPRSFIHQTESQCNDLAYLMEPVALRLLGEPNKELSTKSELRYGTKGSLSIDLHSGVFYDHENNEGGGVRDLIKRKTNCNPTEWLRREKLTVTVIPQKPPKRKCDTIPFARKIWRESQAAIGTLVETYLRSRAIIIPPPLSLRFHPALPYRKSTCWPCMVAVVSNAEGFLGIHRTFLASDGNGKAPINEPKMALGQRQGGAVRLGPTAGKIYIAEGIETALSVMQITGSVSVWATISASGMVKLELPAKVKEVTICADGDPEGERAAQEAGWRFKYEGRIVNIARPPPGKDFNDVLREGDVP